MIVILGTLGFLALLGLSLVALTFGNEWERRTVREPAAHRASILHELARDYAAAGRLPELAVVRAELARLES